MYNLSENIEIIGSIIDDLPVDANKIAKFRNQYEKIILKSKDPNFYLSAIGDFSSGKSTLINKLIKRNLLKVAHTATTAVPTYIYRGTNSHVVLRIKCDDGQKYNLNSESGVSAFEEKFNIKLPQSIDESISFLTADNKLSSKIKEVKIELPEDELVNGLCIIDTPGINPGADFAKKHAEITKHILDEKADAIIILFPADQAYTQSFEKFLKDNAEYFMRDAIFVVTMMDRVDKEERDDVIGFVKMNLRNNFHIEAPQVLSCSAMLSDIDPYWSDIFKEFEQSLMDKLIQNRQRIVAKRLIMLSNDLLNSIHSEIFSQKKEFEKRLSVLRKHSVPNLIAVLADSKDTAIGKLTEIQAEHDLVVNSKRVYLENKIMRKVNAGLNDCDTRSEVTQYVNDSLVLDIETVCQDIYHLSTKYTTDLNNTLDAAISEMIEQLSVYYGEIGDVLPENVSLSISKQQTTIENIFNGLNDTIKNYKEKIDVATAVGGVGLAAIILAGLGPVGWIIGGVAALMGGDRLFVDSARGKVRVPVFKKIPEISQSVIWSLCNGMQTNHRKAKELLEAKTDELVSQYQPIYSKLENWLNIEKQDLICQIQYSEKIQNRVKAVLFQINQIKGGIDG